jgi:hypothetical protein
MKLRDLLIGSIVLAASTQAHAANVIDQSQPSDPYYMAAFAQTGLAQSFSTPNNNVSGAGIEIIQDGIGPYAVTLGLWDNLPNVAGAHELASTNVTVSGNGWIDGFWSPAPVTPGNTYYLTFDGPGNWSAGGIAGAIGGYPNGNVFANSGYMSFPGYDYTFRTYTDTAFSGGVPEPATWAMLLLGFASLGAMLRSRKRLAATAG